MSGGTIGWYEFIRPDGATTHIVHVMEDGSMYFPEGLDVCDDTDFLLAAAEGKAWRLVREDQS